MGLRVTAAQAAILTGHTERLVRWHIKTRKDLPATKAGREWRIDIDALAGIGWRVDPLRLSELEAGEARTAASMAARLSELERQMRDVRARLARLEAIGLQASRSEGQEAASKEQGAMVSYPDGIETAGGPYSAASGLSPDVRAIDSRLRERPLVSPDRFTTKTDAARWLARHGVAANTAKGWEDLVAGMTPAEALQLAITRKRGPEPWRVPWTLRRCTDDACVCQIMLAE